MVMDFNSEASTSDSSPLADRLEKQGLADNENSNDDGDESSRDRQKSSSKSADMIDVKINRDHQMKYLNDLLDRLQSVDPGAERLKSSLRKMAGKILGRTGFPEGKEIHPFFYYHEPAKVLSISFLCDKSKNSPWPAILDMHFGPDIIRASQKIYDIITDEDTSTDMQLSLNVSSDGKRKRGRPRKETLNGGSISYARAAEGVKRKRGRPPKSALGSEYLKLRRPTGLGKRKRGRPRKTDNEKAPGEDASKFFIGGSNAGTSGAVKRGPGRPPKCSQIPEIPGIAASDFFSNSRDESEESEQSDEPADDPFDFDEDDMDNGHDPERSRSSKSRKTADAAPGLDALKFFEAPKSSEPKSSEKRGRGRPKKSVGGNSTPKPKPSLPIAGSSEKRGRGRPRKSTVNGSPSAVNNSFERSSYLNSSKTTELKESDISPAPIVSNPPSDFGQVSTEDSETPGTVKRGRGRPRKNPSTTVENDEQSMTAQPSSNSDDGEKRKRGRPRKNTDESASLNGDSKSDTVDPEVEVEEDEPSSKRRPSPAPESSSLDVTKKEEDIDEILSTSDPLVTDPQQTIMAVKVDEPSTGVDLDCPSSEMVKQEDLVEPSLLEMTRSMNDLPSSLNEADRIALQEIGVESH